MLKNGRYRIQNRTGKVAGTYIYSSDGTLIENVKYLKIEMSADGSSEVRGQLVLATGEHHTIYGIHLTATGLIVDGEPKEDPSNPGPSQLEIVV